MSVKKLRDLLSKNLQEFSVQQTVSTLGDRSQYIGASDIGGCPYQTVMSKKHPPLYPVEKLIVFEYGHMTEEIISKMLSSVKNVESQYEAKGEMDQFQLKAHIDKLIQSKNKDVIIEVKSTKEKLDDPYESWVLQVIYQMGLKLQEDPSKKLEGYIVALNRSKGDLMVWEVKFDDVIFNMCLNKADHLIRALRGEVEPVAIIQFYCSDCPFKMQCPKQGQFAQDLPSEVKEDIEFIKASKRMAKEAKAREMRVKEYMINMGIEALKDEATQTVVTVQEMQSERVDKEKFKELYPKEFKKYKECTKTSSYYRMNVL